MSEGGRIAMIYEQLLSSQPSLALSSLHSLSLPKPTPVWLRLFLQYLEEMGSAAGTPNTDPHNRQEGREGRRDPAKGFGQLLRELGGFVIPPLGEPDPFQLLPLAVSLFHNSFLRRLLAALDSPENVFDFARLNDEFSQLKEIFGGRQNMKGNGSREKGKERRTAEMEEEDGLAETSLPSSFFFDYKDLCNFVLEKTGQIFIQIEMKEPEDEISQTSTLIACLLGLIKILHLGGICCFYFHPEMLMTLCDCFLSFTRLLELNTDRLARLASIKDMESPSSMHISGLRLNLPSFPIGHRSAFVLCPQAFSQELLSSHYAVLSFLLWSMFLSCFPLPASLFSSFLGSTAPT